MTLHRFSFPTLIHFGAGARAQVGTHLKAHGLQRALVVTDRGVAALKLHADFVAQLVNEGLRVASFAEIWGNPVESQVQAGVAAFCAHQADCIIGLGGGAALDVAKAIALMINHPGDLFDYEDEKPGARSIERDIPYWVALPTTAGTGSEVGRSTVISDREHIKRIIFSPKLLARAVFADPELTLDLPAHVTAATGMDALTHCVEAYLAKDYHPICDGIALEGLRLVAQHLVRCVHAPRDLAARGGMLMAAMMGAIAFQKGLGLTHSCAHALATVADLHHGLANAIVIDHALKFNIAAVPERFRIMAQAAGIAEPEKQNGAGFIAWLAQLKRDIGIPAQLAAVGVRAEQVATLSTLAFQDGCHQNNPQPCTRALFERIYTEAL